MTGHTHILELAIGLANLKDLTPEGVERLVGFPLQPDTARSNRFFDLYKTVAPTHSPLQEVDVRFPRSGPAKGPLVHMVIRAGSTTTAAMIVKRFGQPTEVRVSPPQAAHMGSTTYTYRLREGQISFALGDPPEEPVLSITLDRTE